jgi:YfiR/HmsC-like
VRTWRVLASLLFLVLVAAVAAADADAEIEAENRLKAQFIDRFALFIEWPGQEQAGGEPFVIGIYGRTPLARHLRELFHTRRIKQRQARVVEISDLDRVDGCQVLFIAGSAAAELPAILARTATRPILTVGDSAGFARRGVLINLFREGEYMRFEVNTEAVEKSGLRFGSQLLRLAALVKSDASGREP